MYPSEEWFSYAIQLEDLFISHHGEVGIHRKNTLSDMKLKATETFQKAGNVPPEEAIVMFIRLRTYIRIKKWIEKLRRAVKGYYTHLIKMWILKCLCVCVCVCVSHLYVYMYNTYSKQLSSCPKLFILLWNNSIIFQCRDLLFFS